MGVFIIIDFYCSTHGMHFEVNARCVCCYWFLSWLTKSKLILCRQINAFFAHTETAKKAHTEKNSVLLGVEELTQNLCSDHWPTLLLLFLLPLFLFFCHSPLVVDFFFKRHLGSMHKSRKGLIQFLFSFTYTVQNKYSGSLDGLMINECVRR